MPSKSTSILTYIYSYFSDENAFKLSGLNGNWYCIVIVIFFYGIIYCDKLVSDLKGQKSWLQDSCF